MKKFIVLIAFCSFATGCAAATSSSTRVERVRCTGLSPLVVPYLMGGCSF